jgi:hypothetical protein
MAIKPFNAVDGYSVGDTSIIQVIDANANVNAYTLIVDTYSNLGSVSNIYIGGGDYGQVITTDGFGNLSFTSLAEQNSAAPMPYYVPVGNTAVVPNNYQGLFSTPITIDGTFEVDGELIQIGDTTYANSGEILFDNQGSPTGNLGFTFNTYSGNLELPGNLNITGNIIPSVTNTYSLGTSSNRWSNLWLSGSTIYLGNSTINEVSSNLVLTNGQGGQIVVTGNSVSSDLIITGNLQAGAIRTDNYQYANGQPIDTLHAAGSNTQIQFNGNGDLSASANFTFDSSTNLLNLNGDIAVSNISATGNITSSSLISTNGCVLVGNGAIAVIGVQGGIFNSGITDINIGFNANVNLGSITGNTTIRGNLITNGNTSINDLYASNFVSKRPSISVTTNTVIDSFDISIYRSAKYTIKVSDNTGYQALEVLLVHDSINSLITVYGSLSMTGVDLISLSSNINGSNVELIANAINSMTSVNLMATYVPD